MAVHLDSLTHFSRVAGRMKDEATLRDQKVSPASRIMVVGSTVNDIMSVSAPDPKVLKQEEKEAAAANKQSLCQMKVSLSLSPSLSLCLSLCLSVSLHPVSSL